MLNIVEKEITEKKITTQKTQNPGAHKKYKKSKI